MRSADNWYLILAGSAGVYIEELKDSSMTENTEQEGKARKGQSKHSFLSELGQFKS